ncbi:putative DCC family thiol-disulfide oxidoreductase YuxK [Lederbergia galactosidilyticus]|uniref:thiol-disulfide oxidoreductase DCC family protein n=1 Tax=Lederbergia galactosidilytica TaxID=217031 RepID=UPI001AE38DBC|nr:thiol-disulfide oxidoreductase DCC family protein [Lederbergia galactosidilytica]MBP1917448.1 putative DCC family thiol-disulfide oxidoreductase YuxK [Lederbergia galactosidilytica]
MSAIILFDGECNLCNNSVQFIIKHDPYAYFRFSSLQGKEGEKLLNQYGQTNDLNSMILIEKGNLYSKSTAVLRICRHLTGFWKLAYFLIIIPAPIRNLFYNLIAHHRYNWFGKRQACMLPSPELQRRFL